MDFFGILLPELSVEHWAAGLQDYSESAEDLLYRLLLVYWEHAFLFGFADLFSRNNFDFVHIKV